MTQSQDDTRPDKGGAISAFFSQVGMAVVRETRGGMGGVELLLEETGIEGPFRAQAQIIGERNHWSLGFKLRGMKGYRSPDEWYALLRHEPVSIRTIEQQAAFIAESMDELKEMVLFNPKAELEMELLGRAYMRSAYPDVARMLDDSGG